MTDYSKMSDGEINWQVAFHIGLRTVELAEEGEFDPCNNPADAWPIIAANEIGVAPRKSSNTYAWDLSGGMLKGIKHVDDNPLRAAMIVFLLMKESEKC
ncbi:TPA: phage protein NinX family protein [Serratia marcescens]